MTGGWCKTLLSYSTWKQTSDTQKFVVENTDARLTKRAKQLTVDTKMPLCNAKSL